MNLKRLFKNNLFVSLSTTFLTRGIVAIGSYVFMVIIGRLYGAEGVGVFALAQGITVGTVSMLARSGMHIALMRDVGRFKEQPESMVYLKWALKRAFWVSAALSLLVIIGRYLLQNVFNSPTLAMVIVGNAVATIPFTISYTMAGFFKGIRKPATALMQENGMVAIWASGLILLFHHGLNYQGIVMVSWVYAIGAWIVMLQGFWKIYRWKQKNGWKKAPIETTISKKEFMSTSRNFFALNLTTYMQNRLNTLIAGFLLSSKDLGLFTSSQQIGRLINFILMVINAVFPARFSTLYFEGKLNALQKLAKQSSLISIVLSLPIIIVCLLFTEWILSMFGKSFHEAVPLLRIVAIGQLINISTGSVGYLLNMTKNEKLNRNIALVNAVVGIILYVVLSKYLGAFGAAIALSVVLIMQNLASLYYVWRKLGIWVMPLPNVFKIIGVKTEKNE